MRGIVSVVQWTMHCPGGPKTGNLKRAHGTRAVWVVAWRSSSATTGRWPEHGRVRPQLVVPPTDPVVPELPCSASVTGHWQSEHSDNRVSSGEARAAAGVHLKPVRLVTNLPGWAALTKGQLSQPAAPKATPTCLESDAERRLMAECADVPCPGSQSLDQQLVSRA